MRVLALDTTTASGSVAIVDDSGLLVEEIGDPARTHAERLPGDILQAIDHAGLGIADIDLFAIAAGPGTFTGLRIGIAMIQGLSFVSGKRVVPVSALRALAVAACREEPSGRISAPGWTPAAGMCSARSSGQPIDRRSNPTVWSNSKTPLWAIPSPS